MRRQLILPGIVDVHCHVLPGLDDGSKNMDESLEMLRIAQEEGIVHMVCTPHYHVGRKSASPATVSDRLAKLSEAAAKNGIDVKLSSGNEIMYFDGVGEALEEGRIQRMNGTDFVLIEFLPGDRYLYIRNALDNVMGMGYNPVLAHIERYDCMHKNLDYALELKAMGVGIQINASSVTGDSGGILKRYVRKLLKRQVVDYVGTDAHSSNNRRPTVARCAEVLYKKYDKDYVDGILYKNARRDFRLE